jgi:hypothetical protein
MSSYYVSWVGKGSNSTDKSIPSLLAILKINSIKLLAPYLKRELLRLSSTFAITNYKIRLSYRVFDSDISNRFIYDDFVELLDLVICYFGIIVITMADSPLSIRDQKQIYIMADK